MADIQIMPLSLSNQIAAGEVVERPASVVKELVENAIDAGASQIDVRVEEAGLHKIEVIDNGHGIPSDQVNLALERHATSKLKDKEDLFRIRSLGFRGEALPSIASVSVLSLETSTAEGPGRRVQVKGGEIVEDTVANSRQGTSILVENLFYNTPARLKHIKTPQTEMGHLSDLMNRFSFAHPSVAFRLVSDGNMLLNTVGNGDLRQAIAGVYGVSTAKKMLAFEEENFNYKVWGYTSSPDITRSSNKYMTWIVNQRVVKNFYLNRVLTQAYGSKLMVNRYPIAVTHIEMDPLLLDVNVHPTKQQVRISDEKELAGLINQAVQASLQGAVRIPHGLENIQANQQAKREERGQQLHLDWSGRQKNQMAPDNFFTEKPPAVKAMEAPPSPSHQLVKEDLSNTSQHQVVEDSFERYDQPEPSQDSPRAEFPDIEYFGQMHGTYLFAQNEHGLYIIDQHAAQERVKFEYYRVEIGQDDQLQQQLLVPLILEYPSNDYMKIQDHRQDLEEVGIYLESFGDKSFILHSHPAWMEGDQVEGTVREMLDFFLNHDRISLAEFREETAIMMSCKRSIKANHHLEDQEARQLIEDLASCQNPYNCPHGRPVMVQLSTADMEKMFKRIQD